LGVVVLRGGRRRLGGELGVEEEKRRRSKERGVCTEEKRELCRGRVDRRELKMWL
jgi:hypothetical protein